MSHTLKALSTLLSYPTAELQQAIGNASEVLEADDRIPAPVRKHLHALLMELVSDHLYDLQGRYILLFDRTRSLSLYLFEHERERAKATTEASNTGSRTIATAELPDYLPWFLEFLSTLPTSEALELLRRRAHTFSMLAERLRSFQSAYEAVFEALIALSAAQPTDQAEPARLEEPSKSPTAFDKNGNDQPQEFSLASPSYIAA